jgi:hypothetical protein
MEVGAYALLHLYTTQTSSYFVLRFVLTTSNILLIFTATYP